MTMSLPVQAVITLSWFGIKGLVKLLLEQNKLKHRHWTLILRQYRCGGDTVPENCIRNAHSTVPTTIGKSRARSGPLNTQQQSSCSVTGLCWLNSNTLASLGDSDGKVKLWDLRKSYSLYKGDPVPKAELVHPATSSTRGFTSLSCSPAASPTHLYVSCMDSCIYQYDVVNLFQQPTAVFTGAEIKNFFINHSISPCGRLNQFPYE